MDNLKLQYNKSLERYKSAEAYIDAPERTQTEINRWLPEFVKIVGGLNMLLKRIGKHEPSEAINGFKDVIP